MDITYEMLSEQNVKTDECYTATWRESKYTLIHCAKANRVAYQTLLKAIEKLRTHHGILLNATISAYDALSSNDTLNGDSLKDHPGFKRILHLLNTHNEDLQWWITGQNNVYDYRKGLLWRYIETTDPTKMTQRQLAAKVIAWAPIVRECEILKRIMESSSAQVNKPSTSNIRSTLLHYRHEKPIRNMMKEISKLESNLNSRESSLTKTGEIYAAWNPTMTNLHKLGFTCKDAETRVRALQTAGVLEPFQLTRHAHVPDAR